MRLINTSSGELREFFDTQRPRYAILSHTWGSDEISYLDFLLLTSKASTTTTGVVQMLLRAPREDSEGFRKVEGACKFAKSRNFEWIWVDSVCIDKSSSAELSEAINSMWSWYRGAAECLAYLSDVSSVQEFGSARWWSRGWTLQELLAPKDVVFLTGAWSILATKAGMAREISNITKIPLIFLNGSYSPTDPKMCSVAMKMSWVSRRQTTRTEDVAYCMFGLFDVNMPLIYGEGKKAFMRLQLEILRKYDDDSLYAWNAPLERSGLLAESPSAFADCGNITQIVFPQDYSPWYPPTMSSIGLEMRGRYRRDDPAQDAIDAKYGVHTMTTAIPIQTMATLVMHCGPYKDYHLPITQKWMRGDNGKAVVIQLRRFGAIWQRINCNQRVLTDYTMYEPSKQDAYAIYYIEQQGL